MEVILFFTLLSGLTILKGIFIIPFLLNTLIFHNGEYVSIKHCKALD